MSDHYGSITINAAPPVLPTQKQDKPSTSSSKRPFIFALLAFLLIASYFLTTIYLVPRAIQKYLPQYIHDKTGLTLVIKRVQLNPLNFQLNLEQLTADIPDSVTPEPLLQIRHLFIDLDFTSLVRNTFACDKLTVDELQLNLIRYKDKQYNFPVLSHFSETRNQGEIMNFAKLPFLFSLNNISINKSRILFEDQLTDKTHIVEKLQLAIPTLSNFSFQSKNYIQPHFSAVINGSPIQLSGEAVRLSDDQGFQTKLSCSIQSLDLVPYFSYLPSTFPLRLSKGRADTTLQLSFSPNKLQGDRLSIDIKMDAIDIEMNGKDTHLQLFVPFLKLDAIIEPLGKKFHIKDVITKKTQLRGTQKQVSTALQKIFLPLQDQAINLPVLTIDRFLADQGQLTLLEAIGSKNKQPDTPEWSDLQISIKDFHSAKGSGSIHISGEHGREKGAFSWQGNFSDASTIQGKLLLNEFPAATLFQRVLSDAKETIQGTATFSGDLAFHPSKENVFSYTLASAILQFNDLKISEKKNIWLDANSVRLTRLSRSADHFNLGDIFIKGASLNLNSSELPPLLTNLFTAQKHPSTQGIDFEGVLSVASDNSQEKPLTISDVRFQANRLEKTSTTENFAFSGRFADDGIIKAKGIFNLDPTQIQANLAFTKVNTKIFSPFFSKWPLSRNSEALLHGKGIYRFPNPSFQGDLRFTDSLLQNRAKTPLITWESAELNKVSCRFAPFSLHAESMFLAAPRFQWQRSTLSPFQQLRQGLHSLLKSGAENEGLFPVEIKKINLRNASIDIVDKRLSPAWRTTVTAIEGNISPLDTTGDTLSSFTMKGMLGDSPFALSGNAPFFSTKLEAHAKLNLSHFPLTAFSKQLETSPFYSNKATLDLTLNMTENVTQFSSKNEIQIKNLRAASANSDTALTLALLADTDDRFSLNIPIATGSQSLFNETITNFQTTVIRASYAPLLLDRRFKDLQDQPLISCTPGSNTIAPAGQETLKRYAELLNAHPGLMLQLTGMADGKLDRTVLQKIQEELEEQRVETINNQELAKYRQKQQALKTVASGTTIKEEDIAKEDLPGYTPLLPNPVHIQDKTLVELALERGQLAAEFCIRNLGIAPQRIHVTNKGVIASEPPSNGVHITIKTLVRNIQ